MTEHKQVDHPLLTIVAQHHPQPWLEAAASHLHVPTRTQHSTSARTARTNLDKALAAGTPAQITVGRAHLPWHQSVQPMEAGDPYSVVVAGARGDSYLVDDLPGGPWEIDPEQLDEAWAAYRKGRFAMTTVAGLPEPVHLADAVRGALRLTTEHLTGPVLGNAFDVNFGLSGMARLATQMCDTRTKSGWGRRFGDQPGFEYAMARLHECLTSAYTAAGATRPLYARFLREASEHLGAPDLSRAADAFASAAAEWQTIADAAQAAARGGGSGASSGAGADSPTVLTMLAGHVDAAASHEREGVEAIRNVLG